MATRVPEPPTGPPPTPAAVVSCHGGCGDAVSEVPYKIVGVLLVSGLGAGVLGMFL